jgi:hypothetical protein
MAIREGFSCGDRCRALVEIDSECKVVNEPAALPPPQEDEARTRRRLLLAARAAREAQQAVPTVGDVPAIATEEWDAEVQRMRISAELARTNSQKRRAIREAVRVAQRQEVK